MTFYFIGVSNEKGMCMKRPKLWETVTLWQLPHVLHCMVLQWSAPLPLVVTIIIPGSAPRRESNTVRGGDRGRGGEGTCTCILTSVIWHLEAAIGCDDTELTIQNTGKKGCCFWVSPHVSGRDVMSISRFAFLKFICSRALMSFLQYCPYCWILLGENSI